MKFEKTQEGKVGNLKEAGLKNSEGRSLKIEKIAMRFCLYHIETNLFKEVKVG